MHAVQQTWNADEHVWLDQCKVKFDLLNITRVVSYVPTSVDHCVDCKSLEDVRQRKV